MSYHEKRNIVAILSTILITIIYFFYVFQTNHERSLNSTNVFKFWGSVILIFIVVSIVVKIIIYIVFHIIYHITTKEEIPCFSDERDKLIELKATRNSLWIFMVGFLLALGSQVIDMPPSTMFIVFIISGFVSDIAGEISQLLYYRKGI